MLRRQSVLQTVLLQGGSALAASAQGAQGAQAWAREARPNADSGVLEEVAGATFRINDHASFSEGGNLADKVVKTSMGGHPDDRKSIRSWFVADRPVNASPRLSF